MNIIIVIIAIMIFSFNVLFSVCVEKSYKFKRDSVEEAKVVAITTKGPVETKAEGVTFNSNSVFWIWATEHSDTLHRPLFLNVISHWIKVTLLFNKLRPRHGFLKNNKCPKPLFLFRLPTRTKLHYAFRMTLFAFLSFKTFIIFANNDRVPRSTTPRNKGPI